MKQTAPLFLAICIAAGCTPSPTPTAPGPPRPPTPTAPGPPRTRAPNPRATPALTLSKVEFLDSGGDVGFVLEADGRLVHTDKLVGQIFADGRFVDPNQRVRATLKTDGTVVGKTGLPLGKLDATGAFQDKDRRVWFSAEGSLVSTKPEVMIKARGLTPTSRRAAMFALIVISYIAQLPPPRHPGPSSHEIRDR